MNKAEQDAIKHKILSGPDGPAKRFLEHWQNHPMTAAVAKSLRMNLPKPKPVAEQVREMMRPKAPELTGKPTPFKPGEHPVEDD